MECSQICFTISSFNCRGCFRCYYLNSYWISFVLHFIRISFWTKCQKEWTDDWEKKVQRITTNINKVQNGREIHSKLNFNAKGGFTTLSQYFLVNAIFEWHSEIKFSLQRTNSCIKYTHTNKFVKMFLWMVKISEKLYTVHNSVYNVCCNGDWKIKLTLSFDWKSRMIFIVYKLINKILKFLFGHKIVQCIFRIEDHGL